MSVGAAMVNANSRFNAMSLRERAAIAVAVLALIVLLWDQVWMSPLSARKVQITQEIGAIQKSLVSLAESIEGRAHDNPLNAAVAQKQELVRSLAAVDLELASASSDLIPPQRMLSVLRDVLDERPGLRLISMRNLPVESLASIAQQGSQDSGLAPQQPNMAATTTGPYIHSMEMIIDGSYLDVLRYLQAVEALPWHFYWQALELKTTEFPTNRVRIRLSTLSMDKEWLGV